MTSRNVSFLALSALFLSFLASERATADSAVWAAPFGGSGLWTDPTNWNPETVPNGPNDVATFPEFVAIPSAEIRSPIELNSIIFDSGSSALLNIEITDLLTISGVGIVNNSGLSKELRVLSFPPGELDFTDDANAGDINYFVDGGSIRLFDNSSAGSALFIVESNGVGQQTLLEFNDNSDGGTAVVNLSLYQFGTQLPSILSIYNHNAPGVRIGSLIGNGQVLLGAADGPATGRRLTVGSNNLDAEFQGAIEDAGKGGSLKKVGSGRLVLLGASDYSGPTTVSAGKLIAANKRGSATGSGSVNVEGGARLGGPGGIAGSVTLGSAGGVGAFLQPNIYHGKPTTLTMRGSLTFNSGSGYSSQLYLAGPTADQVIANGVTINTGSSFSFPKANQEGVSLGSVFMLIRNASPSPIAGQFDNLPDGGIFIAGSNHFQANYEGGDGNDLTVTIVP
ncbi:MAG TPA: autotransporter-associated beta strand repeat-containing protein [Chthoniobacterales bacterium]|jgi:autotransporter-associated beta strand protein